MNERMTADDLAGFHGGGPVFRHWLPFHYTDGVNWMAGRAEAFWLLDAVFSHQCNPLVRQEPFQVWRLVVLPSRQAELTMTDGNSKTPIIRQAIEFTDFPLSEIELWLEDGMLMLPSER